MTSSSTATAVMFIVVNIAIIVNMTVTLTMTAPSPDGALAFNHSTTDAVTNVIIQLLRLRLTCYHNNMLNVDYHHPLSRFALTFELPSSLAVVG